MVDEPSEAGSRRRAYRDVLVARSATIVVMLATNFMIQIKKVEWTNNKDAIQDLRRIVFIEEQKVSRDDEFDDLDELETTHHFAAFDDSQHIISYARLLGSGKIGRMAVLAAHRNQNIGNRVLRESALFSIKNNILNENGKLFLSAQIQAKIFYSRAGFEERGNTFQEAGIEHIKMEFDPTKASSLTALFSDSVLRFEDIRDIHLHLSLIAKCTSRYIDILSDHLENPIFTDDKFITSLSRAARRSRNAFIRILLKDSKKLHGVSHPIVALSQRLSSKIEIRALSEEPQKPDIAYMLSDAKRMVYFNNESEHIGFANYRAGPEAENILEEFNNLWNRHSRPDPNLRRLNL